MRYFTEEGYLKFHGKSIADAGLKDKMVWRVLNGKKQQVLVVRQLPEGVFDGFHEEAEGAEQEEEVESGDDELREGQAEAKFDALTTHFDAALDDAVAFAMELSSGAQDGHEEPEGAQPEEGFDSDDTEDEEEDQGLSSMTPFMPAKQAAKPSNKPAPGKAVAKPPPSSSSRRTVSGASSSASVRNVAPRVQTPPPAVVKSPASTAKAAVPPPAPPASVPGETELADDEAKKQ